MIARIQVALIVLCLVAACLIGIASGQASTGRPVYVTPIVATVPVWHRTCAHYDLQDTQTGAIVATAQESCARWKE